MSRLLHVKSVLAGIVTGIALTGLALSSGAASSNGGGTVIAPSIQTDQEPLIVYDVSGFGLAGPIHRRMTLFTSGAVSVSNAFGFALPEEGSPVSAIGESQLKWVSPQRARNVWKRTVIAGGLELEDGGLIGADIPLTTVTIFREPGRTANTANFYFATGDAAAVVTIINEFITEEFPGF